MNVRRNLQILTCRTQTFVVIIWFLTSWNTTRDRKCQLDQQITQRWWRKKNSWRFNFNREINASWSEKNNGLFKLLLVAPTYNIDQLDKLKTKCDHNFLFWVFYWSCFLRVICKQIGDESLLRCQTFWCSYCNWEVNKKMQVTLHRNERAALLRGKTKTKTRKCFRD